METEGRGDAVGLPVCYREEQMDPWCCQQGSPESGTLSTPMLDWTQNQDSWRTSSPLRSGLWSGSFSWHSDGWRYWFCLYCVDWWVGSYWGNWPYSWTRVRCWRNQFVCPGICSSDSLDQWCWGGWPGAAAVLHLDLLLFGFSLDPRMC